jgi:hypothetical protein
MQYITQYALIFLGIWLLVLTFFLCRFLIFFKKLTKGVEVTDLKKILEKLLVQVEASTKDIKEVGKRIDLMHEDSKSHVQKVGLVRFNPFKELGGDHSFSLAILDAYDSGVIITGLHTRDRTRVYLKDIKKGVSHVELSAEEKEALTNAQKNRS